MPGDTQLLGRKRPTSPKAQQRRGRWLATRLVLALVIVVALAILPYQAIDSDSVAMLERMRGNLGGAKERLAAVEAQNARLRTEIEMLRRDPRAVEEFARRDLGMVRPGELLIKIDSRERGTKGSQR